VQPQLVTLPYNLLLQRSARESLNISLAGSIVIVDEAHNLIDTILSVHSLGITSRQVAQAREQIQEYLRRFSGRLKGSNEVNLRLLLQILDGLATFSTKWAAKHAATQSSGKGKGRAAEEILTAARLIKEMGGTLDQINVSVSASRTLAPG
jgi:chromosome transmission fidelity protein 1